jgi:hypothetical protein
VTAGSRLDIKFARASGVGPGKMAGMTDKQIQFVLAHAWLMLAVGLGTTGYGLGCMLSLVAAGIAAVAWKRM